MFNEMKNHVIKIKLDEWQKNLYTCNKYLVKISEKQISSKRNEIKNELTLIEIIIYFLGYYLRLIFKYFLSN